MCVAVEALLILAHLALPEETLRHAELRGAKLDPTIEASRQPLRGLRNAGERLPIAEIPEAMWEGFGTANTTTLAASCAGTKHSTRAGQETHTHSRCIEESCNHSNSKPESEEALCVATSNWPPADFHKLLMNNFAAHLSRARHNDNGFRCPPTMMRSQHKPNTSTTMRWQRCDLAGRMSWYVLLRARSRPSACGKVLPDASTQSARRSRDVRDTNHS